MALVAAPGVVLSAVLTAVEYDAKPLWRDEWFTYGTVERPLGSMLGVLSGPDVGLAGYYAVMHVWMLVGDTSSWLRLPGALAAVALPAVVAVLGTRLGGKVAGLVAGLAVAVLPALTSHAQEARPYPLVLLAVAVATLAVVRCTTDPTPRGTAVLAGACTVVALLHPLVGVPAVAGLLGGALVAPGVASRVRLALAGVPAALGAGLLVGLNVMRAPEDAPPAVTTGDVVGLYRNIAGVNWLAALLALLALGGLVALFARRSPAWAPLVGLAGTPLVAVTALGISGAYFKYRYAAAAAVAVAVLVGIGVAALARGAWPRRLLAAGAVAVVLVGAVPPALQSRAEEFSVDDPRAAAAALAEDYRPGDAVVFSGSTGRGLTEHYLPDGVVLEDPLLVTDPVPSGTLTGVELPATDRDEVLADHPRVWVVGTISSSRDGWTSVGVLEGVSDGRQVVGREAFGEFAVELWARPGD